MSPPGYSGNHIHNWPWERECSCPGNENEHCQIPHLQLGRALGIQEQESPAVYHGFPPLCTMVLFLLCEATQGIMLSIYLPVRKQAWHTPCQSADLQHNPSTSPGSASKFLIFLSHTQSRGWADVYTTSVVSLALLKPLLASALPRARARPGTAFSPSP